MANRGIGPNTVGELNVAISADATGVKETLAGVKVSLESTTQAAAQTQVSVAGMTAAIKETVGPWTRLIGTVTATIAKITLLGSVITGSIALMRRYTDDTDKQAEAFKKAQDAWEAFIQSRERSQSVVDGGPDATEKRIRAIEEEARKQIELLNEVGGIANDYNREQLRLINERKDADIAAIREQAGAEDEATRATATRAREYERLREEIASVISLQQDAAQAEREALSPRERIAAELQDAINRIEIIREQTDNAATRRELDRVEEVFRKRKELQDRELDERERKELEIAEKAAARTAKAIADTFANAARAHERELLVSINNIAVAMNAANQKLDLIGRLTRQ